MGNPNNIPSILSSIPPWPGKMFPVFFNLDFLFKYEKIRSPTWTDNEIIKPIKTIDKIFSLITKFKLIRAAKEENKIAPMLPEIVLLGLIDVSLGPFKIFPIVNPPISEKTQIIKIINKIIFKWKIKDIIKKSPLIVKIYRTNNILNNIMKNFFLKIFFIIFENSRNDKTEIINKKYPI